MDSTAIVKITQPSNVKYNFFSNNNHVTLSDFLIFHLKNICSFDELPITRTGFDSTSKKDGYGMWVFSGEELTEIDIIATISNIFRHLTFEFMYVSSEYKCFIAGLSYKGKNIINHEIVDDDFLEYVNSTEYLITREHWLDQICDIVFYSKDNPLKKQQQK